MKKLILLLIICPLFFFSCEDDDKSGALIGTWIGQDILVECLDNPAANSFTDLSCTESSCYRLELRSDGTYTYQIGARFDNGDWFSRLSLCEDDEGETICTEYSVDENTSATLVLSITDESTGCTTSISFERELEVDPDDE